MTNKGSSCFQARSAVLSRTKLIFYPSLLCCKGMNSWLDLRPIYLFQFAYFVIHLQSRPNFRRYSKVLAQTKRRISGDCAFTVDDLANSIGRYKQFPRKFI